VSNKRRYGSIEKGSAFTCLKRKKEDAASTEVIPKSGVLRIAEMTQDDFDTMRALVKKQLIKAFVADVPDGQALPWFSIGGE